MLKEFARGTDFLPGKTINSNGGVVVIQTFFSD
jgi:hypothetical protein